MSKREQQILDLIRSDPLMSQREMANRLGTSRSAIAGHIMKLTTKGIIKGRGYIFSDAPFVVVVGGANLDIHGASAMPLRLHDSNPGEISTSPGGVARNIAENLARLGADSRLIAVVGNDPHGDLLLRHGRAAGIDMQHVAQLESAVTSTYVSIIDDAGDMHVAISDMGIIDRLGSEQIHKHEAMLKQAALVIIDTNLNDDALAWLTGTLANRTLFVDTVSTTKALKIKPYLAAVHTLKPSLIEAEALSGINSHRPDQLPKLADWFHERGVKRLFITLADAGVFYSTAEAQGIEVPANAVSDMSNASGAGDAFLAGLGYAWLSQFPLRQSLLFSMAAASITVSQQQSNNPALSLSSVNRLVGTQHAS